MDIAEREVWGDPWFLRVKEEADAQRGPGERYLDHDFIIRLILGFLAVVVTVIQSVALDCQTLSSPHDFYKVATKTTWNKCFKSLQSWLSFFVFLVAILEGIVLKCLIALLYHPPDVENHANIGT